MGQGDPNINIALLSSLFNTQQQLQFQTYLGQQYLQQLFSQQNQFNAQYLHQSQQSQYQQSQYQQSQSQPSQYQQKPQIPSPNEPEGSLDWEVERILKSSDYYEVMSITRTFTGEELKKSYRKYALLVHPDKNPSPKSEEAFKLLTTAYTCLSDPYTRYKYDHEGLQEQLQQELSKKSAKLAQASLMELYSIFNNLFQDINKSLWG
uniref:J domain-containing protein n=1 Tax=Arcella intermedia TaxID=1963864 RepID=A0A6B2LGK1_9EUKA